MKSFPDLIFEYPTDLAIDAPTTFSSRLLFPFLVGGTKGHFPQATRVTKVTNCYLINQPSGIIDRATKVVVFGPLMRLEQT